MAGRLDTSYYNEDYFKPEPKSAYSMPFTWEVEEPSRMELAQKLKNMFHPDNALDIGCAKGFLCKALLKLGIDAYGCDISEFAVSNCEPEVRGRLKVADMRDGIPYPNESFDLVYSGSTLEHIEMEFLPNVASEIARIARHWVYIQVPISPDKKNRPKGDPSHRTYMPVSYWVSLFYGQGLLVDLKFSSVNMEHPFEGTTLVFTKGEEFSTNEQLYSSLQAD